MHRLASCAFCALLTAVPAAHGQSAPAPYPPPGTQQMATGSTVVLSDSIQALGPVIDRLHQTLVSLNVSKWKIPGSVRSTTQSDVDSMQRDVSNVLPDLMAKAKDAPQAIGPAFAVFRNIDALYDVLLRASETATLAGAQPDTSRLEDARSGLEQGRSLIGNALLQASNDQDAQVAELRAAATRAAAAPPTPPSKTVIDDGATPPTKKKPARRKTPAPGTSPTPPQQ